MATRKDVHRPAVINPSDYRYLFSFSYTNSDGAWRGVNTALLTAVRTGAPVQEYTWTCTPDGAIVPDKTATVTSPWGKLPFFKKDQGTGGCDICGAHYLHGDAWLHRPTGEVVLIGHICAGKMDLYPNRGDWTARQKELAKLRKTSEYRKERARREAAKAARRQAETERCKMAAVEFLQAHPGLESALAAESSISRDLRAKLWEYGSLSENQVALAVRLATERKITPPAGRQDISGEVIKTEWREDDYTGRGSMKVLLRCDGYRLWGTLPADLWKASRKAAAGDWVSFKATVCPKEPGFGFFSRPMGGLFLEESRESQ